MSFDPKALAINMFMNLGNILVLFFVLRMLVYKPLRKFMDARAERVRLQTEQARAASAAAAAMRDGLEKEMREKTEMAAEILDESERKAERRAGEIIKDAQDKAEELLRDARQRIEAERRATVERMRGDIVDMAMQIARKVLEREVSAADNQRLIDEYFRKVS